MQPNVIRTSPTTEPPAPGAWFLYMPASIVDRCKEVSDVAGVRIVSSEAGHTFWWTPDHFVVLIENEVGAYADLTRELTRLCATFLHAASKGGMAAPMATVLLQSALDAISKSFDVPEPDEVHE